MLTKLKLVKLMLELRFVHVLYASHCAMMQSSHFRSHQNNIPVNAVMSGVLPTFLFFQTKWTPSQTIDFSGVHDWLPLKNLCL